MNTCSPIDRSRRILWTLGLGLLALGHPPFVPAYPPMPHHVIYGCVRDEFGTPLVTGQAQVILQTPTGIQLEAALVPGLDAGVNYALEVPMDAGLTPDAYQPTALRAAAPFKMYVVTGQTTNVPIQMTGSFANLGQPGQQTRIDLTLGEDSNGDGLPDSWELAFLAALGLDRSLADLNPNLVLAHDGWTLRQQFLLGNALFNPADSFSVRLVAIHDGSPVLEFTTMTGRSYSLLGSSDLNTWTPLSFTIPSEASGLAHAFYYAPDIHIQQVQVLPPSTGLAVSYFRLVLQ